MPTITGLHHVAILVPDLDQATAWYERVLGAKGLSAVDHRDATGVFAVILEVRGMPGVLQLRRTDAPLPEGYDPLTLEVADDAALTEWTSHLDELDIDHTGVVAKRTGNAVEVSAPGGGTLRFYTAPVGGYSGMTSKV